MRPDLSTRAKPAARAHTGGENNRETQNKDQHRNHDWQSNERGTIWKRKRLGANKVAAEMKSPSSDNRIFEQENLTGPHTNHGQEIEKESASTQDLKTKNGPVN
jgi:hypothetical protein